MTAIRDLARETEAARVLRENLADIIQDEDDARDFVEGETNLNEAIELAIKQEGEDAAAIDAIDEYITALKTRKDRIKRRIDFTRMAIAVAMGQAGHKKIDTPFGTVSLRHVPPKAIPTDETLIPKEYWKLPDPKLDLAKLTAEMRDRSKAGKPLVPGVTLSNGSETVTIRRD